MSDVTYCVLVVEDDALLRSVEVAYLSASGFRTLEASSVDEAEGLLSLDFSVRIVVSDVNLGGGKNGDDLAQWLAVMRPQLPLIITSALGRRHRLRTSLHSFIGKPFALADLVTLIRRRLNLTVDEG